MSERIQDPGVNINAKNIALVVGIISIIGAASAVFDKIHSYDIRIHNIEQLETSKSTQYNQLSQDLRLLNSNINQINLEVKEVKVILDMLLSRQVPGYNTDKK